MSKQATLQDLIGDTPTKPVDIPASGRRPHGRPRKVTPAAGAPVPQKTAPEPKTFADACLALSKPEREYVRGVLRGLDADSAIAKAWRKNAPAAAWIAAQPRIVVALKLGRAEVVEEAGGIVYDAAAAERDLVEQIALAKRENNLGALATLQRLRMQLNNLLVERSEVAHAGFTFVVNGVDPSRMTVAIDGTAKREDNDGSN